MSSLKFRSREFLWCDTWKALPLLTAAAALLLASLPLFSQASQSAIQGAVYDQTHAVIAGATVQVTNDITKQVREFTTSANGSFIFPDLVPADYDLKVTHPGFKTYKQNRITVGNTVVDHELVIRAPGGEQFEIIAIYTFKDGLIARVDFAK